MLYKTTYQMSNVLYGLGKVQPWEFLKINLQEYEKLMFEFGACEYGFGIYFNDISKAETFLDYINGLIVMNKLLGD